MRPITLHFRIEPVPKGRPRVTRYATFTPKKTLVFEKEIAHLARTYYTKKPLEGHLAVLLKFYLKRGKTVKIQYPTVKPDIDNLIKSVLDPLNGIIWGDDSQIVEIAVSKRYETDKKPPGIELTVLEGSED